MRTWFSQLGSGLRKWLKLPEPPPPVRLRTERLCLREIEEGDWPRVLAYHRDPEVLRYMARTQPYAELEVRLELRQTWGHRLAEPRRYYRLAIVLEAEQQFVGEISLFRFTPEGEEAVIGFLLAREYWRHGYTTEAARELVRFGFAELGLERITGGCHPENTASRRVLEKAGLPYWGTEEEFIGAPDGCIAQVFSVEREAWLAAHAGSVASAEAFAKT